MCPNGRFRFDLQHDQDHDRPPLTPHDMKMAQATWHRLTTDDLSGIRTTSEFIARVEERYSLSHEQAITDVEFWALDKQL
jgi:hypothetical protein